MVTKLETTTPKGNCLICSREVMWVTKDYDGKFPSKTTLRNVSDQQAHNVKDGVDDKGKPRWTCSKDSSSGFAGTYQSTPKYLVMKKLPITLLTNQECQEVESKTYQVMC